MAQLQYPLVDVQNIGPDIGAPGLTDLGHSLRQGIGNPEGSASVAWHMMTKPGAPAMRHMHRHCDEIAFHISGTGIACQGDRHVEVSPGLCRFVPKGTPHYFIADKGPAVAVGFLIGAGELGDDMEELGQVTAADAITANIQPAAADGDLGGHGLAVHIDDVAPEQMATKDGWSITDFRLPIAGHNGSKSTLFRARFMPDAIHKKHRHDNCDEIYYIISGHGMAGAGNDRVEVRGGQFHYIPAGVEHWLYNLSDTKPIEVVGIYVDAGSVAATGYVYMGEVDAADIGR